MTVIQYHIWSSQNPSLPKSNFTCNTHRRTKHDRSDKEMTYTVDTVTNRTKTNNKFIPSTLTRVVKSAIELNTMKVMTYRNSRVVSLLQSNSVESNSWYLKWAVLFCHFGVCTSPTERPSPQNLQQQPVDLEASNLPIHSRDTIYTIFIKHNNSSVM